MSRIPVIFCLVFSSLFVCAQVEDLLYQADIKLRVVEDFGLKECGKREPLFEVAENVMSRNNQFVLIKAGTPVVVDIIDCKRGGKSGILDFKPISTLAADNQTVTLFGPIRIDEEDITEDLVKKEYYDKKLGFRLLKNKPHPELKCQVSRPMKINVR